MLLTESPWNASATTALEPAAYALRLHGGTEHEQSIPIPLGKHSIGSGPRCSLRLQFPGVVPMQCLIAYDGESLRVRRWAENSYLNGEVFDDAELTAGDVLTLGPVDLEVVQTVEAVEPPETEEIVGDPTELEQPETDCVATEVKVAEAVTTSPIIATPADVVNEDVSAFPSHSYVSYSLHPANEEPTELEATSDYLPVASEKSHADGEEQFEQMDRAIDALSTIDEPIYEPAAESVEEEYEEYAEGSLEAALSAAAEEPTVLDEPLLLTGPKAEPEESDGEVRAQESKFDAEVTNDALETVFRELQAGNAIARGRSRRLVAALRHERDQYDVLAERVSALEERLERPVAVESQAAIEEVTSAPAEMDEPSTVIADTSVADTTAIEGELAAVREQLAVRVNELSHAQYSIDALERQLIDSQHTFNAFVEERTLWEEQFSQLEMQLSQYVARVQELEQQLEEVRAAHTATEEALAAAGERMFEAKAQAASIAELAVESTAIEPAVAEPLVAEEVAEEPIAAAPESRSIIDQLEEELAAATPEVQESLEIVDEAGEQAATDEPEVDAALEHLRDLAILRQDVDESTVAMDEEAVEDTVAAAPPVETKPKSQPTSFLERYSHMFKDDTTPPEPPPRPAPVVAEPAVASEDEESVEQYMANLLGRMRGTASAESSTVVTEPATRTKVEEKPAEVHVEPMQSLDEMKAATVAPEQASDIVAMRALANESARHAIGVHTARTLRRKAKTRAVISLLGAAVGFYLLLLAPSWQSLQFVAGCAAAIAALYWGRLTLISLIKGIQVGAFQDMDEIADPAEVLHPKLPIDVEPKTED